jgi:hypothetical protein
VVFGKGYIKWCSSAEWIATNRCSGWVPWDDVTVMSAGRLRKLWDSLSELRSSLCERWLERTVLSPVLLPIKTVQFTQFFSQVLSHSKITQFNWECIRHCTRPFCDQTDFDTSKIRNRICYKFWTLQCCFIWTQVEQWTVFGLMQEVGSDKGCYYLKKWAVHSTNY